MAVDNRSTSALFKRAEQIRRWQESDTNKQEISDNHRTRKVNFTDGCIFLAACAAGDKQEVIRLLEKGADIDTANVDGLTALHAACIDDNLDMVEFLVDQGTDVNRGDMEGWTPLHATASCGFNSIAKFLIDRGADLSLVNNDGDLAIDIADSDEMEMLLQQEIESRGIDCEASRNREERRMLEDAQHWLQSGYLADRPHSKTGATALHVASAKGYIKVMSLLIEAGADINAKDNDGWTPLHAAAHWGQREAIEILCENMADMEVRNFVGQSAFDVADNSLLRLMDELKKKQAALKLVNQNKQVPRKRKTSPHREHSNKKEREDSRESDGTSGEDESSSDVEKRNKVNKENATPQIIPTSVLSNKNRTQSEARSENAFDESEVQSWRRPSSFRKNNQEDKNQKEEASRTSSTTTITTTTATTTTTTTTASTPTPSARISGRDAEEERKRSAGAEKEERNHMDSMEPHVSSGAVLTTNTSPTTRSKGSNNVTTLTTNGGLSTLPPPPKTAPSLPNSTPPASTKQPSPSPSPSPPIATTTTKPPTPPPAPPQTPPSAQPPAPTAKMSPGGVIKNFFNLLHSSRSFMPPSRDEESETQRKAHAKMVRSTRRSTQGVTLEDLKSAEQLMKNKQQQQQATSSSPESKETSSTTTATTTTATTTTTTTSPTSPNKPKPDSPTKADDEERRPSWRLKVDDTDKNRFSLENVRSKDKPEVENDADTPTFTVQLRKKNTEEKDEEKESERNSQTREGTQAAIQRRKKPKRRSTGKVQVNMDEIDPEKRAQRSAEQQQRQGEEGSDDDEEEAETVSVAEDGITLARCVLDNQSVSEKGDAARGSTTSLGSALSSRAASRSSSVGPENGDIDYKKLYEEQLAETHRVNERLRLTENELRQSRESIDLNTKKFNTRLAIAESEKREKRSLERKLSEMEEELKQLQKLKAENEKLKAENRALTRVVSKLTNSATSGMGSLATLSK
ncbi:protein phosphatase 1 regulatory subunit 12A-like isoform X14 [Eriocheir sinensis]|uniref:protein phosphatase 1 regulatory subunit 12A-like isoform X14 n=1 Tax=Eriocheir sinensis TaxID=95602 RepID=UPI0021C5E101|nr:protein phosphatase 1 regulatory subunit 12A-like isoform X14 [Eriocheir sinensis]